MRYFIAHLPKGPIVGYHRGIVQDVASRFHLGIDSSLFPTHFTIKAPFEIEEIDSVKNVLGEFAKTHSPYYFDVYKFGHFDNNVIYLNVRLHQKANNVLVTRLQDTLKELPGLTWGEYEPLRKFHITVAKKGIAEKFDDIWDYVQEKPTPHFELLFDNVALLRKENSAWVVDSFYPLSP